MTDSNPTPLRAWIGLLLVRVVVPLWILVGATFKLVEASPRLLPKTILDPADKMGIDLFILLAVLIALEFLAIAVMVFIGRWARAMAIFMLASFCLILLGEIAKGSDTCGCLGTFSPSPWLMLAIDGVLLLGVILFAPPAGERQTPAWRTVAATVATLGLGATSFAVLIPRAQGSEVIKSNGNGNGENGNGNNGTNGGDPKTGPLPLPSYWYCSQEKIDAWTGRPWGEAELFRYLPVPPVDLDTGTHYVAFYSFTCDHCEEMFDELVTQPALAATVLAIEVPPPPGSEDVDGFEMPPTACQFTALPAGVDWIITTPLAFRIENGIVECGEEGDHHACFGMEGGHSH
jgi:hypothetical protein